MKILFIQLRFESNMAVMGLSGLLNQQGYETEVMIIEGEPNYINKIKHQIKPDIIGFSSTTVDIKRLLEINQTLKEHYRFFSIFGGPHPTFFPELIDAEPAIDAICVGEGDEALVDLARRMERGQELDEIFNLYLRKGTGRLIKNRLRPLIDDLDSLPFMNKHLYDNYYDYPYLLENVPIRFLSSRGCPYKCTYCFNHKFHELYGVKGNRVRKRSVESLLDEIRGVKKDFDIPMVSFVDDIFCVYKDWVEEFAQKYPNEIGLPYSINTRPNTITEEIAVLLSQSGCYYVTFSIETGDEYLRNKLLKRKMSEGEIIKAANLLHKYNIHFSTGNMLAMPGETFETLKKTVEVNRKCAPHYAWASLFQPFPKLELSKYAIEHGYFDGDYGNIGNDQFTGSVLRLKDKDEIVRFHKFFALLVRYPYLYDAVLFLIKLPLDGIYQWIFQKYKIRLNKPVINAQKDLMERQSKEPLAVVVAFLLKDFVNYVREKIVKNK